MNGYFDNDAICKLCILGLANEAMAALELGEADVFVLDALKYQVRRRAAWKPHSARIEALIARVQSMSSAADDSILSQLRGIPNMDAGEMILFANGISDPDAALFTGDKRAIKALHASPVASVLAGRVVCFEQIMRATIRHSGFDLVKKRCLPSLSCDGALRTAFGSGEKAQEKNVLGTLEGYVSDLRSQTGNLLSQEY